MTLGGTWRTLVVSGSAALLWLLVAGAAQALAGFGVLRGLQSVVVPAILPGGVWAWPPLWTALAVGLGALAVGLLHATIAYPVVAGGRFGRTGTWIPLWLAAVAAGGLVGLAVDAIELVGPRLLLGSWMWWSNPGMFAAAGAYWGLVYGWIPGLISTRLGAYAPADEPGITRRARTGWVAALSVLSVVAVFAFGAVGVAGLRIARVEQAQQTAIAEGHDEAQGALPDPFADGVPVPTTAPQAVERDPSWCTSDQAMLLLGEADAATGHRVQSIRIMNFSEQPCAIEGYPDIAFADQNGHLLEVTIERGNSFMATDAGSQRIEIPPHGEAVAYVSWDAQSTAGALVATSLFAAPLAGDERGSWPVETDVIAGTTVTLTAWQPAPAAASTS